MTSEEWIEENLLCPAFVLWAHAYRHIKPLPTTSQQVAFPQAEYHHQESWGCAKDHRFNTCPV